MSYSAETNKLNLPLYLANDHPTWMQDFNDAMEKIDGFAGSAGEQNSEINTKINSIEGKNTDQDNKIESLQTSQEEQLLQIQTNATNIAALEQVNTKQSTDIMNNGNAITTLTENQASMKEEQEEVKTNVSLNTSNINHITNNLTVDNDMYLAGLKNIEGTNQLSIGFPYINITGNESNVLVKIGLKNFDLMDADKVILFSNSRSNFHQIQIFPPDSNRDARVDMLNKKLNEFYSLAGYTGVFKGDTNGIYIELTVPSSYTYDFVVRMSTTCGFVFRLADLIYLA